MRFGIFGNITEVIDLPDTAWWIFFVFFLGLVWYNRRQDKREGYPMKESPFSSKQSLGFPLPPEEPQAYLLNEGGITTAPHYYEPGDMHAKPLYVFAGTPLTPVGNPLLAGIGPGAWVKRKNEPMLTEKGELLLEPMRKLEPEWSIGKKDADPRGMKVFDWRWNEVGIVHDVWIDQGIKVIRMFEVDLLPGLGAARVLVPLYHTTISERMREIRVTALRSYQFADIPMPAKPGEITAREDERLNAYFAAGHFYRNSGLTERPAGAAL